MKKIGRNELIFNETFFLSDKEKAEFEVVYRHGRFPVTIEFQPEGEGTIRWHTLVGNVLQIECLGWNNPIGTATIRPVEIGEVAGNRVFFGVVHHKISPETNVVTLQFYLG
jgi:hypothetical protein